METFKKAKCNNIPVAFSKAQPETVHIRGKLWTAGKPLELLCSYLQALNPNV